MKNLKKLYLILTLAFLPIIILGIYIFFIKPKQNISVLEYIPNNPNNFYQLLYLKFDNNYSKLLNSLKNKQIYDKKLFEKFNTFINHTQEIAFYKSILGNQNIEFAIFKLKPDGNIKTIKKSILGKPELKFNLIDKKNNIYIYSKTIYQKPKNTILSNPLIKNNIQNYNILFLSNIDQNEIKKYLPNNTKLNIKNLLIKGNISNNINLSIQTIFKNELKQTLSDTFKTNKIYNFSFKSIYKNYFSQNDLVNIEIFPINTILDTAKPLLSIGLYNAWTNSVPEPLKNLYTEKDFENLLKIFDNNIGIKIYPYKNFLGINIYTQKDYLYDFFNKFRPIITAGLGKFITGDIKIIDKPNSFGFTFKTKLGNNLIDSNLILSYTGGMSILSLGDINLYSQKTIKSSYNTNTLIWGYLNFQKIFEIIDKNIIALPIQTYQEDLLKFSKTYFNLYIEKNKLILDLNININ